MYSQQGASFKMGCYLEIGHTVSCKGTSFIFPVLEPPNAGSSPCDSRSPVGTEAIEWDTFTSLCDGVILLPVNKCLYLYFLLVSEEAILCAGLFQFFILLEGICDRKSLKIKKKKKKTEWTAIPSTFFSTIHPVIFLPLPFLILKLPLNVGPRSGRH